VISLLLSLFVILLGGLSSPAQPPPSYSGTPPTVVVKPVGVRVGRPAHLSVLGMPRGASHVKLVTDGGAWPTHVQPDHVFTATLVPQTAGPWELDIRFLLHGHRYTVLGTVISVRSG
jgi:hypothetical protein